MNEEFKLEQLRKILSEAGNWYRENRLDDDLIYDESITQFDNLTRSEASAILTILFKP